VIEKLENHMQVSGNPLSTQKSYIRGVRDLMEGLGSIPESLTVDQIKAHLSSWRGKVSSSALNLRVCGIKYYFRNVVKRPDLAVDVPNPRVAKYIQEVLRESDLEQLFAACRSMRELALLHLLYDTGIRSREVCCIKLCDFEKVHRKLTICNGKGEKLRVVPYSEALRQTLIKYFISLKEKPQVYLFENKEVAGQGITVRGVQYIVKEVLKRSKLKKEVHPHTYRHTFAVHYMDNGGNIKRLQELLGHEDLETTLHYLKFSNIPLTDCPTPLEHFLKRQGEKNKSNPKDTDKGTAPR
jgi:site-specific recombinase XerD